MRAQVEAEKFRGTLSGALMPIVRSDAPILECLHLSVSDGTLTALGIGSGIEVHARCEASVSSPGTASVKASDLKAISSRLKGCVRLELSGGLLSVRSDLVSVSLPTVAGEFQRIAKPTAEGEIEGGVEAIKRAAPFCSHDEVRAHLMGVGFDGTHAVASDDKKIYVTPAKGGGGQSVPFFAASVISKIGGRLFLGGNTWRVENEGIAAAGPLLEAGCPDWRRIVSPGEEILICDASDLGEAVSAVTAGRAEWCIVSCDESGGSVSGDKFNGVSISGECRFEADGATATFVCFSRNFLACLKPFYGSVIRISVCGPAVMISPDGRDDCAVCGLVRDHRNDLPMGEVAA